MSFSVKQWKDLPDRSTPTDAAGLMDMETRLGQYVDQEVVNLLDAPVHSMALASGVETLPRWAASVEKVLTGGTILWSYFVPHQSFSVSKFRAYSGNTASSGLTLARFGLALVESNGDLTLLSRSASNTTLFNSANTSYTENFATTGGYPANYNIQRGVTYAAGVLCTGTTMPTLWGAGGGPPGMYADSPKLVQVRSGQTDIPASIVEADLADGNFLAYVGLIA